MDIYRTTAIQPNKEDLGHGDKLLPLATYHCVIPTAQFPTLPPHWHSEFEINYIREGSAEFICGEDKFTSAKGDIIITQPNVMHSIYPCARTSHVYDTLVFSSEIFGSSESDSYMIECIRPLTDGSMRITTHITPKHHYYAELAVTAENIFT